MVNIKRKTNNKTLCTFSKDVTVAAAPGGPPSPPPSSSSLDDLLRGLIGNVGKYQIWCCVLLYLCKFPVGWNQISIIILAAPMKFACADAGTPAVFDDKCVDGCSNYAFDTSTFSSTIISDFALICENSFFKNLTQTIFMFGILVGGLAFGHWSDRIGRRIPLIVAVCIHFVSGVAAAFAPEWFSFTFFRFLLGVSTGANMTVSFVLVMEVVGVKYRELLTIVYQLPFAVGHISLAGFGQLKKWNLMQLGMAAPTAILLSYICFLTESPRWLITHGKTEKATQVLEKAAKCNGKPTEPVAPAVLAAVALTTSVKTGKTNFASLFLHRKLRIRLFASNLIWWSCGFGYFGVAQHITRAGGNIFLSIAISGSLAFIGILLAYPMNWKFGRKWTIIINNVAAAICMFIPAATLNKIVTVNVLCGGIGLMCLINSFTTAYLYTGELFPTTLRSSAIGMGSAYGRIGSMMAPFVATLEIQWLASLLFGVAPLISALFTLFFLLETKWKPLPDQIEDIS